HLDLHSQFLREEVRILSQHRELVHGAEPISIFDPCVSQLVRDLLRVCGYLLRPFPYPGLCQGLLHQDVHREGLLGREASRELVDAELPRWRRVESDPLRRDPGHLEDLADVRERRLEEYLCCRVARMVRFKMLRNHASIPCPSRRVECFAVAKRTQSCRRSIAVSAKSKSTFGSSRPSPAFATVSRITSAGQSRNASRMNQVLPR